MDAYGSAFFSEYVTMAYRLVGSIFGRNLNSLLMISRVCIVVPGRFYLINRNEESDVVLFQMINRNFRISLARYHVPISQILRLFASFHVSSTIFLLSKSDCNAVSPNLSNQTHTILRIKIFPKNFEPKLSTLIFFSLGSANIGLF